MSFNRPKRPSSARRNIKHETFSNFVSGSRLRHVQSLLNDGTKATEDYPDAILCITGIDSRYNDGTLELINYLLFGFFEIRKAELEGSGFDEEIIDDVLILIQRDKVDVYCNPINYHYLLPYVSHWRNVFFHCLTDTEYEDEEVAEDFKISTFVSIIKDCNRIGIPYSNSGHRQKFDAMLIEKWPIIQVYGVEGVGGGGFFTMRHDVVDISNSCHQIYEYMDPVALETLIIEQVTKLDRQWQTMLSVVSVTISNSSAMYGTLTEDKVFEPLRSFYLHGRVSGLNCEESTDKCICYPFVLFGKNTIKQNIQETRKGLSSPNSDLKSTTVGKMGANFMICKAVSPRGPVMCARTYFFMPNFINPFQETKVTEYNECSDIRLLTTVYGSMIDALLTGIQAYCNTLSARKAELVARETLTEGCSQIKDDVVIQYIKSGPKIEFTLQAVDSNGSVTNLEEGDRSLLMKCASITVFDIPSYEKPGTILGSLVFSESFMDSEIRVKMREGSTGINSSYLLLTDHIPRFHSWTHSKIKDDRELFESKLEDKTLHQHFGDLLLSGDPVNIGCASTLCMPPEEASLYAYENGLIIVCPQYGAIVLHGNHIRSARFYDGDSSNTVAVLVIEYHSTFVPFIPNHLRNEYGQIVLLFTPKSKAYKHLYSDVLYKWREDEDSPKVKRVDVLPENCHLMHNLIQHKYMSSSSKKIQTSLQKASVSLPHLYRFLDHFSASSVGWYPIPECDINKILKYKDETDMVPEPEAEIIVTIISGVPGSYQDQMCDVLSNLSKEQNRYVILKQPLDGVQKFNPMDIQAKLKATLNVHRRRKLSQGDGGMRNTRVLYVVPGYTDIVNVVSSIVNHPDHDVRTHCTIGSVTACVDPLNVFMEHKYTFPYLLNACSQGWVNQIVMTSSTTLKNEELEEIQHLLRSVNSDVAFLLAEQGNVSRSMDLDAILSEESFQHTDKLRARYLLCPDWRSAVTMVTSSPITSLQVKFNLPLDRQKLVAKLRGTKSTFTDHPFTGNIYNIQGKVKFSVSSEPMEVRYTTMNGGMIIQQYNETPREKTQNPGNFMTFTGYDLTPAMLKDWLRECAPKKPEKKPLLCRKDIDRDTMKKIQKDHHLDKLPDGWFYNGTQYVSFDGEKQNNHPNLDEFVDGYLNEMNAKTNEYNAQMEELLVSYKDLFS